jgi:hypothetical protein
LGDVRKICEDFGGVFSFFGFSIRVVRTPIFRVKDGLKGEGQLEGHRTLLYISLDHVSNYCQLFAIFD